MKLFQRIQAWLDGAPDIDSDQLYHREFFFRNVAQVWLNEELIYSDRWTNSIPRCCIKRIKAGPLGWIEEFDRLASLETGEIVTTRTRGNVVLIYKCERGAEP